MFMAAVGIAMKQKFMNGMMTTKVSDLDMISLLDKNGESFSKYQSMFDILSDFTITEALTIVEGMPIEIDTSIKEEMSNRKLDTLVIKLQ